MDDKAFFDTGLDFDTDTFTPAERAAVLGWYDAFHAVEGMDLAPFAPFWIAHDPGGFKRLKQHLLTLEEPVEGLALPAAAGVLMYAYTYAALGNAKGALYEIIAARQVGATRAQVGELVRLAALAGGPLGINALAEIAHDYLESWVDEVSTSSTTGGGIVWPDGWHGDRDAFRAGVDPSTADLSDDDLDALRSWHRRVHGEVPAYVEGLAAAHPRALKTLRLREENAVTGDLPAQLVPLLRLHLALARRDDVALRREAEHARALGVRRQHLVGAVLWGSVPGGAGAADFAWTALADVLARTE